MTITQRMLSLAVGCFLIFAHTCAYAGNDPVTVQLKWLHQFQFAGLYMALEKGYYQDAGLDVRLIEGGVDTDAIDYVTSHQAAYGVADSSALLAAARGKPIMALGAIFSIRRWH